ncbi:DUF1071 domain-containing protein [Fusobacterium necrophorum]|uniref:Sak single strand annealing protein n=1 Tax=Fusobacterium necrophorum TaxID=859 RepID=UPI0001BC456A|nr:DUF1071 domain-containing protein [Fusobacterium necrophorum]EFS22856.1 hypothetical protein FSEG_00463 [Fusobacterium necrophorum D12]MDK4504344.1 DUF1071 domain-containing protein [Fusobacterium necrophorum]
MKIEKFNECYTLDINMQVEQDYKGLNYLSWASAYKLAMEQDPTLSYEIAQDQDGLPFFSRGDVHIVKTKVTMFGETKEMFLPIMDNKHNAVSKPNARQVNDNIMRCLAKNIAMFGIGLPLYVGEDLAQFKTTSKEEIEKMEKLRKEITRSLEEADDELLEKMLNYYSKKHLGECTEVELRNIKAKLEKERKKRHIGEDEIGGMFSK